MTTTIAPALGSGLMFTQGGTGTSPGYAFLDFRRALSAGLQEGVIDAGSYEVTQRAAGANLSVDIAASTGTGAYVQGDSLAVTQGLYYVPPHSAVINEAISAAHATLPRIDQVILEVQDTQHDSSGANAARVRVVTGTATAAATLDNRNGAAALPSNAIRLADVLVAATDTAISNSEIRDRRPWARGAYVAASGDGAADFSTAGSTTLTAFSKRVECSGVPLEIEFAFRAHNSTAGATASVTLLDGAIVLKTAVVTSPAASETDNTVLRHVFVPSAGSHAFSVSLNASAGTAVVSNTSSSFPTLTISEAVRQNTANNATTSG